MRVTALIILSILSPISIADSLPEWSEKECINKPESTICLALTVNKSNSELKAKIDEKYESLLGEHFHLTSAEKTELRKAKADWFSFSKTICQIQQEHSGSAYSIARSNCLNELYRSHIEFLSNF